MPVSLLDKYGWPPNITGLSSAVWGSKIASIQYDHHTHSEPLRAHGILPQGDPLGPIICSLWVQRGEMSVSTSSILEAGPSSLQIHLDDRTCTSSSVQDLFTLKRGGLAGVTLSAARKPVSLLSIKNSMPLWFRLPFGSSGRSLGRVVVNFTASKDRIAAATATARLLGCCGFLLPSQLSYLKQFALPKANYGWVARVSHLDCR